MDVREIIDAFISGYASAYRAILTGVASGVKAETIRLLKRLGILPKDVTDLGLTVGGIPWASFGLLLGAGEVRGFKGEAREIVAREIAYRDEHDLKEEEMPIIQRPIPIAVSPREVQVKIPKFDVPPVKNPFASEFTGLAPLPPAKLTELEREAWLETMGSAGTYCRGLGNEIQDTLENTVREIWDGETPLMIPEPETRNQKILKIRRALAESIGNRDNAKRAASAIGHATGDWSRNLQRIAETEMQGAINKGVAIGSYRTFGDEARIALVPANSACPICLKLNIDEEGNVRIHSLTDILDNGTNVGKKPDQWLPTVWPIHPRCTCKAVSVPPGMVFQGKRMVKDKRPIDTDADN